MSRDVIIMSRDVILMSRDVIIMSGDVIILSREPTKLTQWNAVQSIVIDVASFQGCELSES